jgi:hypothetical protein
MCNGVFREKEIMRCNSLHREERVSSIEITRQEKRYQLSFILKVDDMLKIHFTAPASFSCHSRCSRVVNHGPSSQVGIGGSTLQSRLALSQNVVLVYNKSVTVPMSPKNPSQTVVQLHNTFGVPVTTVVRKSRTASYFLNRRSMLRLPKHNPTYSQSGNRSVDVTRHLNYVQSAHAVSVSGRWILRLTSGWQLSLTRVLPDHCCSPLFLMVL